MNDKLLNIKSNILNINDLYEKSIYKITLNNLILNIENKNFYLCKYLYKTYTYNQISNIIQVDSSTYIQDNEKIILYILKLSIKYKNKKTTLSILKRIDRHIYSYCLWCMNNNINIGNSILSSKKTFYLYLENIRNRYFNKEIKNKPIYIVNDIINMLGEIYNTNDFYPITFENNNEKYKYLQINEQSIEECIESEKNNKLVPLHNLILNINGMRIFIFRFIYTDYIATCSKIFVNEKSFSEYNLNFAKYIYENHIRNANNNAKYNTIKGINNNTYDILKWSDKNQFKFNSSIENTKYLFKEYTLYLRLAFREGKYSTPQHLKHHAAYKMIKTVYNDDKNYILDGMKLISNSSIKDTTEKSSEEQIKYHYTFYLNFFNQVTNFILKNRPYPLKLKLINNSCWCLPARTRYIKNDSATSLKAFDSNNGKIKDLEEFMSEYATTRFKAEKVISSLRVSIEKNNQKYSTYRIDLAKLAQKAFFMLFLTNTGMNDSNASTLLWNKKYELEKEKIKFSTIKYRSNGKIVSYQIQNKFITTFKKYLELREYLLKNNSSEYLFFEGYGNNTYISNDQKEGRTSSKINSIFIKKFDNNLPRLSSKILRVNKATKVTEEHGILAASNMMQNSISTFIRHYQGESLENTGEQLSNYFEGVNNNIFNTNENMIETAIGKCSSTINEINKDNSLNCSKKETCLFCKYYRLHVDSIDLQKVYSLKYIINECKYIAKNETHFDTVYKDTLNRIEEIENLVLNSKRITLRELNSIKKEVFEDEILHPYWENKLEMLLDIGVLR